MSKYRNYPISCKSCGEPIAAFAEEYEALVIGGKSIEDALNIIGIMNLCTRINMKDSPTAKFDAQDIQVIEGLKDIRTSKMFDIDISSDTISPSDCSGDARNEFIKLGGNKVNTQPKLDLEVIKKPALRSGRGNIPTLGSKAQIQVQKVIENIDSDLLADAIPLGIEPEPTVVGVPVILKTDQSYQPDINVGAGRTVKVLPGRIFLCR